MQSKDSKKNLFPTLNDFINDIVAAFRSSTVRRRGNGSSSAKNPIIFLIYLLEELLTFAIIGRRRRRHSRRVSILEKKNEWEIKDLMFSSTRINS